MALEVPQLVYTRVEEDSVELLTRALRLAKQLEGVLDDSQETIRSAHSTRIVRAMAASLVDELEALVRGRKAS